MTTFKIRVDGDLRTGKSQFSFTMIVFVEAFDSRAKTDSLEYSEGVADVCFKHKS